MCPQEWRRLLSQWLRMPTRQLQTSDPEHDYLCYRGPSSASYEQLRHCLHDDILYPDWAHTLPYGILHVQCLLPRRLLPG
jgi:hypothetical protein